MLETHPTTGEQKLVLIDFGMLRSMTAKNLRGLNRGITPNVGTPNYSPPERGTSDYILRKFDVYSLGKCISFMLVGNVAHDNCEYTSNYHVPMRYIGQRSEALIEMLKKTLAVNPNERWTVKDLVGCAWMTSGSAGACSDCMLHHCSIVSADSHAPLPFLTLLSVSQGYHTALIRMPRLCITIVV